MLYDQISAAEMAAARITPALDAEGGTGATALLHGILATLSESLERLDRRLVALEGATEERLGRIEGRMEEGLGALTEALRAATEAEAEPEPDPEPDDSLDRAREELLHALDAVAGRIEARLEEVRDAVPVPDPAEAAATRAALREEIDRWGRSLHDEVERLGVLVRGQLAEVSGQAASVAAVLGRLDGHLHSLVEGVRVTAQQARALRHVDGEPEGVPETLSLS